MPGTPFVASSVSTPSDADSLWDESAGVMGTTVDIVRVNSDGAGTAQVDIGLVGPGSQAALKLGGDVAIYRNGSGDMRIPPGVTLYGYAELAARLGGSGQVAIGQVGPASQAGITLGAASDATLYRSAAAVLATDGSIITTGTTTFVVAGNGAASEVKIGPAGPGSLPGIVWGSAEDTNLYRSAADTLKTDDTLKVGSSISMTPSDGAVFSAYLQRFGGPEYLGWASTQLSLVGAGLALTNTAGYGYIEIVEGSDPAAPAADKARLFVKDNGSGKTQLVVVFATGAVQVLATQP